MGRDGREGEEGDGFVSEKHGSMFEVETRGDSTKFYI